MANAGKVILGLGVGAAGVWGLMKILGGSRGPVSLEKVAISALDFTTGETAPFGPTPVFGRLNLSVRALVKNHTIPADTEEVAVQIMIEETPGGEAVFATATNWVLLAPPDELTLLTGGASEWGRDVPGRYRVWAQVLQRPNDAILLVKELQSVRVLG